MTTKAAPVSSGSAAKKACSAWMPPAEAPMPTMTGFVASPCASPLPLSMSNIGVLRPGNGRSPCQ